MHKSLIPFGIRLFHFAFVLHIGKMIPSRAGNRVIGGEGWRKGKMDIYIVRKCRVEMKEFSCASGAKYKLPVMTADDIFSYIINKALTPVERDKIQRRLENYYASGDQK